MTRSVLAYAVSIGMVLSVSAGAQDGEAERKELFRQGSAAADTGEWVVAAEKFRQVVRIRSAPKALIALGIAEEHLGHLVAAEHDYDKAVADARAAKLVDDERTASQALAAIAQRVPMLAVHLPSPEHVRELQLDGRALPLSDADYSLDPREHVLSATGGSTFRKVVDLKEGDRVSVSVDVVAARTVREPSGSVGERSSSKISVGAIVVGAVGLVGVGIGAGLWGVGVGQQNDVKSQCGGTTNCALSLKPEADSGATNIIAGDVLFGIGATAVVAGAAWLVISLVTGGKQSTTGWLAPTGLGLRTRF